jgi:hypothetical protein
MTGRIATICAVLLVSCSSSRTAPPDVPDGVPDLAIEVGDWEDLRIEPVDDIRPDEVESRRPGNYDELMEEGRYWLSNAEPGFALNAFEAALALQPQEQDALFACGLAAFVQNVELFAMVLTLPTQFGSYGAGEGNLQFFKPESENDYLVEELHRIFMELRSGFVVAEDYFKAVDDPGLVWTIEQVPIYVFTRPVVNLRGAFDYGDVQLLLSANAFFLWFTELFAGQDFHTDLLTIAYSALDLQDNGADLFSILELASTLMASDPQFLELHHEDGEFLFERGGQHMWDIGFYLVEGLYNQSNEPGEVNGHAVAIDYRDGNPVMVITNRVDFHSQEEEVLSIEFAGELLSQADELLAAFDSPGDYVPFSRGPAIQLGIVLGMFSKLDLLRFSPVEIPIDLSNLEPGQVTALLGMFLGNSFGFDYGTLFQNPIGLRQILPLMLKEPEPQGPEDFWMEWECPGEIEESGSPAGAGGFVCSATAELIDAPHFVGTEYEIPADGLPSGLPYMVWEDPTMGGMLGVDELYLDNHGDPQNFVTPDLRLTNLGLHLLLEPIIGLLR